jgi:hypothetical protein
MERQSPILAVRILLSLHLADGIVGRIRPTVKNLYNGWQRTVLPQIVHIGLTVVILCTLFIFEMTEKQWYFN